MSRDVTISYRLLSERDEEIGETDYWPELTITNRAKTPRWVAINGEGTASGEFGNLGAVWGDDLAWKVPAGRTVMKQVGYDTGSVLGVFDGYKILKISLKGIASDEYFVDFFDGQGSGTCNIKLTRR